MPVIAEEWTTGICNVLENGESLHDMLFTYLSQTPEVIKLRQQGEEQQARERARERVERAVKDLKDKTASENEEVRQIYKQITPTFDPRDDGIWSEIDLLEGDPVHRGVAVGNPRFKPFGLEPKATSGKASGRRACLRSGTDPTCYPMIVSLHCYWLCYNIIILYAFDHGFFRWVVITF